MTEGSYPRTSLGRACRAADSPNPTLPNESAVPASQRLGTRPLPMATSKQGGLAAIDDIVGDAIAELARGGHAGSRILTQREVEAGEAGALRPTLASNNRSCREQ